jgi:hypothetical protein
MEEVKMEKEPVSISMGNFIQSLKLEFLFMTTVSFTGMESSKESGLTMALFLN